MPPTIYPSIPAPGMTLDTIVPTINAMRQSLTMLILNAQQPNPAFTPSTAAQIFVTRADLQQMGLIDASGQAVKAGQSAALNLAVRSLPQSITDQLRQLSERVAKLENG